MLASDGEPVDPPRQQSRRTDRNAGSSRDSWYVVDDGALGEGAVEARVAGAVDLAHAALAEQADDLVVGEGLADQ